MIKANMTSNFKVDFKTFKKLIIIVIFINYITWNNSMGHIWNQTIIINKDLAKNLIESQTDL